MEGSREGNTRRHKGEEEGSTSKGTEMWGDQTREASAVGIGALQGNRETKLGTETLSPYRDQNHGKQAQRQKTAQQQTNPVAQGPPHKPVAASPANMVMAAEAHMRFVPMTVDATIGGVHIQPLVDTGTGISLVHTTTLERLQSKGVKCMVHQQQSAKIVSINSNELATLGFVWLPVTMGSVTQLVEFCVVPACPTSILLGTGALSDFGVWIHFKEQVLVLLDRGRVLVAVTMGASACYRVFLAEELQLSPHSVTRVHMWVSKGPVPWSNDTVCILVEQSKLGHGLKTSQVVCTLADVWQDTDSKQWTVTDVANFSTRPIHLVVGTLLAEAEQVEEDWVCSIIEPGPGS
jgi:hypothetical protein